MPVNVIAADADNGHVQFGYGQAAFASRRGNKLHATGVLPNGRIVGFLLDLLTGEAQVTVTEKNHDQPATLFHGNLTDAPP